MKVLIVEDDPTSISAIRDVLEIVESMSGIAIESITIARSYDDVAELDDTDFDLVLLDHNLIGDLTGEDVYNKFLRNLGIPVVGISNAENLESGNLTQSEYLPENMCIGKLRNLDESLALLSTLFQESESTVEAEVLDELANPIR